MTGTPTDNNMTEQQLRALLCHALSTLHNLHTQHPPRLHLNIQPDNLAPAADGTLFLIQRDGLPACPPCQPIEQWATGSDCDSRSDLYSLGATCYYLITGQHARNKSDENNGVCYTPLATQSDLMGKFSPELLTGIDKSLCMHPSERWKSAADWLSTLQNAPQSRLPMHRRLLPWFAAIYTLLVTAAAAGYCYLIPAQSQQPPRTQTKDKPTVTTVELFAAIQAKDTAALNSLLAAGGDVNAVNVDGTPLLFYAIEQEHTLGIQALLAAPGININATNANNITPLSLASWKGLTALVQTLLAMPGIDVNIANNNGDTALQAAALGNNADCITALLTVPGIKIYHLNQQGYNALHICAATDHTQALQALLAAVPDIDVNSKGEYSTTPLHFAAFYNSTEATKILLAHPGINANAVSKTGHTPLHIALSAAKIDCARLLLAVPGIDINRVTELGDTSFQFAVEINRPDLLRNMLSITGANPMIPNHEGATPLHRAAAHGNLKCLEVLLEFPGIDLESKTTAGFTALQIAEMNGHQDCVKALKEAGATAEICN